VSSGKGSAMVDASRATYSGSGIIYVKHTCGCETIDYRTYRTYRTYKGLCTDESKLASQNADATQTQNSGRLKVWLACFSLSDVPTLYLSDQEAWSCLGSLL